MGLFGGFKAKFTRNSTPKNKPGDVVCLKYHVHPEFDGPDPPIPIKYNNNIKKTEVVRSTSKKKERKGLVKSAIFPENETSQSSISISTPQKSLSLNDLSNDVPTHNGHAESSDPITVTTTLTVATNGNATAISDTTFGKSTEEHDGVITKKVAVVTNNYLYNTDSNVKREQHKQTVYSKVFSCNEETGVSTSTQYTSTTDASYSNQNLLYHSFAKENGHKDLDSDQSTLISMTQHSSRNSSFDKSTENEINLGRNMFLSQSNNNKENSNQTTQKDYDADYDNFNLSFVSKSANLDNDDDYFKVNVVKYDVNRTYSYSEDEHSYQEEEPQFTKMGYSSQAASIFFGEGDESEITRPRNIQLMDDDDDDERRSSGADC